MAKISTVAVSEKGAVKPAVRTLVNSTYLPQVADALAVLGFTYNADKKAFDLALTDTAGNTIYMTLSATVGTKASADKAAKKTSKKVKNADEVIEIED